MILKSVGGLLKTILALGTKCNSRASNFKKFGKDVAQTILRLKFSVLVSDVLFGLNLSVQVEANEIIFSTIWVLKLDWIHFFLRHSKLFKYSDCDSFCDSFPILLLKVGVILIW